MASLPAPVRNNPNAATAGVSGIGVGTLVVWLLGHFGVTFTAEVGSVIAGAVAALTLWIGKNGLQGALRIVWRGQG